MTAPMSSVRRGKSVVPRLSIIVATWNAARTLEHCVQSVIGQDFDAWELLIADGGSNDGTVELIRANEAHLAWWRSEPDKGIYDAWNHALEHAKGEYVCFLGADDAFHSPDTIKRLFDAIGPREYDLVTGRGALVDSLGHRYHDFGAEWNYHRVMRRMTICHPGALHRRDLFQRFGAFDLSYRISADYEFLLRLPADLRSLHVNMVIADVEDGGVSRNRRWLMLRERFRAQANCPRIGLARACLNYIDKLWRIPVAKALRIPN